MAVKTRPYKAKKSPNNLVRAVKVNETNIEALAAWLAKAENVKSAKSSTKKDSAGDLTDHKVTVHLEHIGVRVIRPGDFAFKLTLDGGKTMEFGAIRKADEFEAEYNEVRPTKK